ncbi:MAG TPA: hypothetical protein VFK86_13100 [Bauldia sp.]|nr:hypothetical protein [Bauldia sp.]
MVSIPENPKDQFLFFIDNPIVAGEPGGNALIKEFKALMASVLGSDGASTAMAALFADDSTADSALLQSESSQARDDSHEAKGDDSASAALGLVLGLFGGLARGELDV